MLNVVWHAGSHRGCYAYMHTCHDPVHMLMHFVTLVTSRPTPDVIVCLSLASILPTHLALLSLALALFVPRVFVALVQGQHSRDLVLLQRSTVSNVSELLGLGFKAGKKGLKTFGLVEHPVSCSTQAAILAQDGVIAFADKESEPRQASCAPSSRKFNGRAARYRLTGWLRILGLLVAGRSCDVTSGHGGGGAMSASPRSSTPP